VLSFGARTSAKAKAAGGERGHRREIWAESDAAIHTWDENNYYAFDAFSCRDFRPRDVLRLLLTHFDIEMLNFVNLFRPQRSRIRAARRAGATCRRRTRD
jgi:hypothetical protein